MTSKQRAYLKKLAGSCDVIFQVGKNGITPELVKSIDEALEARELIKGAILNNCILDTNDICRIISERTRSEVVQLIGKKIVLFRRNSKKPIINF